MLCNYCNYTFYFSKEKQFATEEYGCRSNIFQNQTYSKFLKEVNGVQKVILAPSIL